MLRNDTRASVRLKDIQNLTKRILLTGASGWIGNKCIAPLLNRGFEIHAVRYHRPAENSGVTWHQCDLLNADDRRELIAAVEPTHLLHFAWYVGPGYRTSDENQRWLAASTDLFGLFFAGGGKRLVGAGSCFEYDLSNDTCFENEPANLPSTLYSRSKLWLSFAAHRLAAACNASYAWGRIFFAFGPNETPDRLVPQVVNGLLRNERIDCISGEQLRDFLYVDDVADAFAALMDSACVGPINVAGGNVLAIRDLIGKITDRIPSRGKIVFGARPASGDAAAPKFIAAISRLRDEVGWRPSVSIDEGIARSIAWWTERDRFSTRDRP